MNKLLQGAAAGCAATVPMTLTMEALHRLLPADERYPLPPREIALKAGWQAGLWQQLGENERFVLTLVSHFGMGTAAGAAYGLFGHQLPLPPAVRGAAFGLAVWAVNYLGLLPAAGLLSPATSHPPRRSGIMIAAHLAWGAAVGLLTGRRR